MVSPVSARYQRQESIFNVAIRDPRFRERETEWYSRQRKRDIENRYVFLVLYFSRFELP